MQRLPNFIAISLLLLLLLVKDAKSCLRFVGSAPWDNTAPFEAMFEDNGVVTCWISESYTRHDGMQRAWALGPEKKRGGMEWEFRAWEFECEFFGLHFFVWRLEGGGSGA